MMYKLLSKFDYFWCFCLMLLFFEVVSIFLTIIIIHYIFLISFGTPKIYKLQISYFLKEIISNHDNKILSPNYN